MNTPTPLVKLDRIAPELYAKIEYLHPSGSMKHRSIPVYIEEVLKSGELAKGQTVVIHSVGSAAVTTAWAGARHGNPVVAVVPPFASEQVVKALHWLGAKVQQIPPPQAKALMDDYRASPDVFVLAQTTQERLLDHYRVVGAEILKQLPTATAVTVGLGTGLSSMGIMRELQAQASECRVYGVEPAEAVISMGEPWAPHRIPGLSPPVARPLLKVDSLAGVVPVASDDAWSAAQQIARTEGWLVGPSSGATLAAAQKLRHQGVKGPIVAIFACSMNEYFDLYTSS